MELERILALLAFAVAGSWTPGPNNAMLAASGARFGFRATAPHAAGVALGFPAMCFVLGLGLGEVFARSALLREALRVLGAAAMLWIAWKIATAPPPGAPGGRIRPLTFLEAAAFQWVNPKAWTMCIGVLSQFSRPETPGASLGEAALVAGVFLLSGGTSAPCWALFGQAARGWLGEGLRLRIFNLVMAGLVAAGVLGLLAGEF